MAMSSRKLLNARTMQIYEEEDDEPYLFRLHDKIRPSHYDLQYEFDWQQAKFYGTVTIHFQVLEDTSYIVVHARGLNVRTETVVRMDYRQNRRGVENFHTFAYKKFDYWITQFENNMPKGEYQLRLRFNGILDEKQIGLFKRIYSNEEKSDNHYKLIGTKFKPTFARLAFPCFDEPDMKATFNITLIYPAEIGYNVLSNMRMKSLKTHLNKAQVQFHITPIMSPHMVCFLLTNFESKSELMYAMQPLAYEFELRIFAEKQQLNKLEHAMFVSVSLIEYLIWYFQIAYALPKLDLVAIANFTPSIADHWGLILFDDELLFYDAKVNTSANKQRVTTVIAHALTQMWLGCLVTPTWWNDLWLFEGFASYMEYKCIQKIFPNWNIKEQFLVLELYPMMAMDAWSQTQRLAIEVKNPYQIPKVFEQISYMKGAAIIRMIEGLIGPETLRLTIIELLTQYAYGNARVEDFIVEMEKYEKHMPIRDIIRSFTEQVGLPFITVTKLERNVFKITQKRFLADSINHDETKMKHNNWIIPLSYVTNINPNVELIILREAEHLLRLTGGSDSSSIRWIKLNKDNIGYYRVNYSGELWHQLTTAVLKTPYQFSISDRAQLLSDAFTFGNAGLLSYTVPLELVAAILWREMEFVPWYVAMSELKTVSSLLIGTDIQHEFLEYAQTLILNIYRHISWTSELTHLQNLLRVTILDAACAFELQFAQDVVADYFQMWLDDQKFKILPDLKCIILFYGMQVVGNTKMFHIVWKRFIEEKCAQERLRLLRCLSAIQDHSILSELLESIWVTRSITDEEFFKTIYYISCNIHGRDLVWNYIRKSWPHFLERFGTTNYQLSQMIPEITKDFNTHEQLKELQEFLEENTTKGIMLKSRNEAINKIKYNMFWLSSNEGTITYWLHRQMNAESFHSAVDYSNFSTSSLNSEV